MLNPRETALGLRQWGFGSTERDIFPESLGSRNFSSDAFYRRRARFCESELRLATVFRTYHFVHSNRALETRSTALRASKAITEELELIPPSLLVNCAKAKGVKSAFSLLANPLQSFAHFGQPFSAPSPLPSSSHKPSEKARHNHYQFHVSRILKTSK